MMVPYWRRDAGGSQPPVSYTLLGRFLPKLGPRTPRGPFSIAVSFPGPAASARSGGRPRSIAVPFRGAAGAGQVKATLLTVEERRALFVQGRDQFVDVFDQCAHSLAGLEGGLVQVQ